MIDLILEVPEASQEAVMADPAYQIAMQALGAFAARTGFLLGTRALNGKRLVLAQAQAELPLVQTALTEAGLPWVIVAAASSRVTEKTGPEGESVSVLERYWLAPPDLAALADYAADVVEFDIDGVEVSRRRPTLEELGAKQWHHWGRPWPALGVA